MAKQTAMHDGAADRLAAIDSRLDRLASELAHARSQTAADGLDAACPPMAATHAGLTEEALKAALEAASTVRSQIGLLTPCTCVSIPP